MTIIQNLKKELGKAAIKESVPKLQTFFKTGKGEYAEGDKFIGVKVPDQRSIAKKYFRDISLEELQELISSNIHEHRLTALFMLAYKYPKLDAGGKKNAVGLYLKNTKFINNWDLVDSSAPYILGAYLFDKVDEREILYKLSGSKDLWERRIAMLATQYFIRKSEFEDALELAEILLEDKHDLIHKAVGWMLREIGNRDRGAEEKFLQKFYKKMPRTMLRYAVEKLDEAKKNFFMSK